MSDSESTPTRVTTLETGVVEQINPGTGAGINTVINNFVNGEDIIDLSNQYRGITSFDQLQVTATEDGTGVVIDLTAHGGGLLTINGITIDDLDASDFVFYVPPPDLDITGTDGDDFLWGGAGDDTLTGGAGDDELTGGHGRDVFVFDHGHGNDTITDFNSGFDKIDISAFAGISRFEDLTITAYERDTTTWEPGGVEIDLTPFGGGTIRLQHVQVDEVRHMFDDMFILNSPPVLGTAGDDTLEGDDADNIVIGAGGDDTLTGGAGADVFVFASGDGNDTITDFTDGEDLIDLTGFVNITGVDDLSIADVDDGKGGTNAVITLTDAGGFETTVTLEGVSASALDASDFVFYDPTVNGTAADDILAGRVGNDVITGLGGDDTLTGGLGADTFVFASGHGHDTVTDFTDGEDLIDLSAFTGITGFGDLRAMQHGNDVMIDLSGQEGGGTITLQNFNLEDLDANDFIFYETPSEGA